MKQVFLFLVIILTLTQAFSQTSWENLGSDELFKLAREKAFANDRVVARKMLNHILQRSPGYSDVRIFLGRTYAWDGKRDSARFHLRMVLQKQLENIDAINALTDVEIWDEKYSDALMIAEKGLTSFPNDEDLLFKKADILASLKKNEQALAQLNALLTLNPSHEKGIALMKTIRSSSMKYTAGVNYGLDVFSKTFDPAHYASIQVGRTNTWGSLIARVNYSHRFQTDGVQPEIDLYPKIVNGVYAYLNYGFSSTDLFPSHRIGGEVHTKLPRSFEASAGVRYLYFDSPTRILIYTGSLGWYYKNYWFSLRPYITPDADAGTSFSMSGSIRRYWADSETYLALSAGLGFSPDIRRIQTGAGISDDQIFLLRSQRVGITVSNYLNTPFLFNLSFDLSRQQLIFSAENYIAVSSVNVGVKRKF